MNSNFCLVGHIHCFFFLKGRCLQFRSIAVWDVHRGFPKPSAGPREDRPGNERCAARTGNAMRDDSS